MPEPSTLSPADSRRQLIQGTTVSAGVLLVLALFAMVNYLAMRHYQRLDVTSSQIYSLSEKSLAVARGIDRKVDLVIFLSPASELFAAVDELLSRYAAANPQYLNKREVDPAKDLLEARRLVEKYSIERENVLVIATEDDRRVIDEFDLAEYDYSGVQMGQGRKLTGFKGEQLITSALLGLVEGKKPKILFTTGHGEARLERGAPRSFSQAADLLGRDNFEIEEWSSLGETAVPAGTDLVVVAGPTTNFLGPELDLLEAYLATGGRLMMLLDPVFAKGSGGLVDLGLDDWLAGHGIEIRDDVVIDPSSELPFFGPETLYTDSYGDHPIVEALDQTRTRVLLPLARSVSRGSDAPAGHEIAELVRTSEAGWGETDLSFEEVAFGDGDTAGPVTLGVAVSFAAQRPKAGVAEPVATLSETTPPSGTGDAEDGDAEGGDAENGDAEDGDAEDGDAEGGDAEDGDAEDGDAEDGDGENGDGEDGDAEADAPEARIVVFGDFDFASDAQIANFANGALLLNALNWLVKREELIDIDIRRPEFTRMSLTDPELFQVFLLVILILPGLAIATGVWVHFRRRR